MKKNTNQKCVYCLEEKLFTGNQSKGCQFSSEHVLNRAFVAGFSNSLTLIGKVCHICNQWFNQSGLDSTFTRFAPEGFSRFIAGDKNINRIAEFEKGNPVTDHSVADERSPAYEALTIYRPLPGKAPFALPAQVIFIKNDVTSEKILWSDFVAFGWEKLKYCESELKLVEDNEISLDDMLQFIASKVKITTKVPAENLGFGILPNKQNVRKNQKYERAVAKTAFNYLVFTTQKTFPEVPYLENFNSLRSFILSGTSSCDFDFVSQEVHSPSAHANETAGLKHKISLDFDNQFLICTIQVYSGIIWKVVLSELHDQIPLLRHTHIWDCDTRTINQSSKLL